MAGYTAAIAIAKSLGHKTVVSLLDETLNEETQTAKLLVTQAKPLLKKAAWEADANEEENEEPKDKADEDSDKKSPKDASEAEAELKKG